MKSSARCWRKSSPARDGSLCTCERLATLCASVQGGRPHLIVVDAGLRDGTALKLADAIRAEDPSLPVMLLTTHHLEKSDLPSRGARLITKSIDLPELRRTVETALLECDHSEGELGAKFG